MLHPIKDRAGNAPGKIIKALPGNKKEKILQASISVFAEKGFRDSTIADLSSKAGISEATIYNYFQNKEQILFTIPIQYANKFISDSREQLTGIKNPEEKLRKFVWHYLWWSQRHKELLKVFMLEIQSNPHYYDSEIYAIVRKIGKIPNAILEEGKRAGQFREEIDNHIFKKFLIGTIDYIFLTRIVFNRPFEPLNDYDDLTKAFTAAIKKQDKHLASAAKQTHNKRERILLAAEELLSHKAFVQTSISEIASTAGVADGTIYEYFENKEAVLFSLYEKRMEDFSETFDEAFCPMKPQTKLKQTLWHFLNWAQNRRPWTLVYLREIVFNPRFYRSQKHAALRAHDKKWLEILTEGQQQGIFRKDMKTHVFRALVFGPLHAICYPWAATQKDYSLINELAKLYDLVYPAIKAEVQVQPL
jgi:TetR/AcrR family fatty acid metabolism transcriptional regulator